jgi:hypothetical protein
MLILGRVMILYPLQTMGNSPWYRPTTQNTVKPQSFPMPLLLLVNFQCLISSQLYLIVFLLYGLFYAQIVRDVVNH